MTSEITGQHVDYAPLSADLSPNPLARAFLMVVGVGILALAILAAVVALVTLRSAGIDSLLAELAAVVLLLLVADYVLAISRQIGYARRAVLSMSGLGGDLLPAKPGESDAKQGMRVLRTPVIHRVFARYPAEGVPWSNLVVFAEWGAGRWSESVVVRARAAGPDAVGLTLFADVAFALTPEQFSRLAERALHDRGRVELRTATIPRERVRQAQAYGNRVRLGNWLRLRDGLHADDIGSAMRLVNP